LTIFCNGYIKVTQALLIECLQSLVAPHTFDYIL
jgi:hypothetical protein